MPRYSHVSRLQPTRCTIEIANAHFCDAESAPDMPFAICASHAIALYRRMHEMVSEVQGNHREYPELHNAVVESVQDNARAQHQNVYYVRVGDLIKIGKTAQLRQRLSSYPPGSELLAVEYGDGDLEGRRLHQFRHLLVDRKEWFRPGPDLLDHIAKLTAQASAA